MVESSPWSAPGARGDGGASVSSEAYDDGPVHQARSEPDTPEEADEGAAEEFADYEPL